MKDGFWSTYFVSAESKNDRVFDHFDGCGNILAAEWVSEATWALIEIMGHRSHVGTVRALPHGFIEVIPLERDGANGAPIRYAPAAIFAITDCTEAEARESMAHAHSAHWADDAEPDDDDDEPDDDEYPL